MTVLGRTVILKGCLSYPLGLKSRFGNSEAVQPQTVPIAGDSVVPLYLGVL